MEERPKRSCRFIDNWIKPPTGAIPVPSHAIDPQSGEHVMPDDWLQLKTASCIYISAKDIVGRKLPSYFYCSIDDKWYVLADTIGNIKKHLKSSHHAKEYNAISQTVIGNIANSSPLSKFNEVQKKIIGNAIKGFIINKGGSFASIGDPILSRAFDFLGGRDKFRDDTIILGERIQDSICKILHESSLLSMAYDVWEDNTRMKYFGVTGKCFYRGAFKALLLALEPITSDTALAMKNAFDKVVKRYSIQGKILSVVSDNCNAMLSLESMLNIFRFPCMCHVLDRVLAAFLNPKMSLINRVNEGATHLKNCSEFREFIRGSSTSLMLYTQIRWNSLKELIDSLEKSWDNIKAFFEKTKKDNVITEADFNEFMGLKPFVNIINTEVHVYENDNFANSSLILGTLGMLKLELENERKDLSLRLCASSALTKLEKIYSKFDKYYHPFLDAAVYVNPCLRKNKINKEAAKNLINALVDKYRTSKHIDEKMETDSQSNKTALAPASETPQLTEFDKQNIFIAGGAATQTSRVIDRLESEILRGTADDLLNYWIAKTRDPDWCDLATVAIHILSVLVSSCSAERAFSVSGRCKARDRMRLMGHAFESQVLFMANEEIAANLLNF